MSSLARRYYVRGHRALERGELEVAEDNLQAALELAPAFAPARITRSIALFRSGQRERAASLLRAGIPRARTPAAEASLYAALGDVLVASGELDAAWDAYEQCARHPALSQRAASGRAKILAKRGRYRESVAELSRAATQTADPSRPRPGAWRPR